MTGPPPVRSLCGATSQSEHSFLLKIVWSQSRQDQNQTGAAKLSAGLLRFLTEGRIKRGCGFTPRLHGLYSQSHCFKYIFSWLNKEKKGPDCAPRAFRDVALWSTACEDSGERAHFCRQTSTWTCQTLVVAKNSQSRSHLFHQAGCRMSPDDI